MANIIEVEGLTKKFGDLTAVDGVSLSVGAREIFGFLGPNGAGKSTTIKILATLLKPTSGKATLAGYDIATQPNEVRQSIGLVFQDPSLDIRLTAEENLKFHAMLYDVPNDVYTSRADSLLKMVDLVDRRTSQVMTYSGGMKRRLEIARGLLHHPKVLFLDEPTLGLDVQTRNAIWNHVRQSARRRRHDGVHDDALHGRGGELRPDRDHRPRQDPGDRHAGRAQAAHRRRHDHRLWRRRARRRSHGEVQRHAACRGQPAALSDGRAGRRSCRS